MTSPQSKELEAIIRFNINASLIHDDRIADLVVALEELFSNKEREGRIDELQMLDAIRQNQYTSRHREFHTFSRHLTMRLKELTGVNHKRGGKRQWTKSAS